MATPTQITNAERYQKAMADAEKLRREAAGEIIERINRDIAELNTYGHTYRLTQNDGTTKRGPYSTEKYCVICGVSGHDGRTHRHQATKRKFTAEERKAHGLERG